MRLRKLTTNPIENRASLPQVAGIAVSGILLVIAGLNVINVPGTIVVATKKIFVGLRGHSHPHTTVHPTNRGPTR